MNTAIKAVIAASFLISLFQVSNAYFYHKENRYAHFLKKWNGQSFNPPSVSGLNIKVTDDSLNSLVDTFLQEFGEIEDFDRNLLEFEGKGKLFYVFTLCKDILISLIFSDKATTTLMGLKTLT